MYKPHFFSFKLPLNAVDTYQPYYKMSTFTKPTISEEEAITRLCLLKKENPHIDLDILSEAFVSLYNVELAAAAPEVAVAEPEVAVADAVADAAAEQVYEDYYDDYDDYENDGYDPYEEEERCKQTADYIEDLWDDFSKSRGDASRARTLRQIMNTYTYDPAAHVILQQQSTREHAFQQIKNCATRAWFQNGFYVDSGTQKQAGPENRTAWNNFAGKMATFNK